MTRFSLFCCQVPIFLPYPLSPITYHFSKVVGSIPYQITSPLIHQLADLAEKIKIDSVRKYYDKKPLKSNDTLKKAATDQANYMNKKTCLTHFQNEDKKKYAVGNRVSYYGYLYSYVGENLSYSFLYTHTNDSTGKTAVTSTYEQTANIIIKLWVASTGHFTNITRSQFTNTGVAVSFDKKKMIVYACQVFASH